LENHENDATPISIAAALTNSTIAAVFALGSIRGAICGGGIAATGAGCVQGAGGGNGGR
jgi:hypothetical protein